MVCSMSIYLDVSSSSTKIPTKVLVVVVCVDRHRQTAFNYILHVRVGGCVSARNLLGMNIDSDGAAPVSTD